MSTTTEGSAVVGTMSHETIQAEYGVADISPELVDEYPVCCGPQRQGDVIVWPHRPGKNAWTAVAIPAEGVAVVRGEVGGHTHLLQGAGVWAANPSPVTSTNLVLGVLTIPDGGVAFLGHEEHRMKVIGAGCYTVERQRERERIVRD